ncbi:hypothetical protein GCM10023317_71740 [Actinopolymorpha pittospori]
MDRPAGLAKGGGWLPGRLPAMSSLVPIVQAAGPELPVPGPVIGLLAFVILLILLAITLAIGKGRPHS